MRACSLPRANEGATAAEFALVLPLLLLLIFGIIDAGRFAWEFNRAEKATQVGARVAVVTDSVPTGLRSEGYVGDTITTPGGSVTLTQGDRIPKDALGEIRCTRTACSCVTAPCPTNLGALNSTVFDQVLLPRMQSIKPDIVAGNIQLSYRGSGLGYAGDPNGMEIAPLVTVQLTGLQFRPVTSLLFAQFTMPDFGTTLTIEDALGESSN